MQSDVASTQLRPISCHQANWIKILVKLCRYSKSCHGFQQREEKRKKMLATRWRDKSPNNFIFIAQRFVDCYILARTKAEHCTAVLQFCLCCRCKLMVHLQQKWPAINLNLNGAPASMRGQNAGRCFLAFHIFHTPSTGFPSAFCYLPATCCFLLPPFFGSAHL